MVLVPNQGRIQPEQFRIDGALGLAGLDFVAILPGVREALLLRTHLAFLARDFQFEPCALVAVIAHGADRVEPVTLGKDAAQGVGNPVFKVLRLVPRNIPREVGKLASQVVDVGHLAISHAGAGVARVMGFLHHVKNCGNKKIHIV